MDYNALRGIVENLRELIDNQGDFEELMEELSINYEFWMLKWANKTFVDISNDPDETELDWT